MLLLASLLFYAWGRAPIFDSDSSQHSLEIYRRSGYPPVSGTSFGASVSSDICGRQQGFCAASSMEIFSSLCHQWCLGDLSAPVAWLFPLESASIPFKSSASPSTCTGVMWRYSGIRFRCPICCPLPQLIAGPPSGTGMWPRKLQNRKHSTAMAYEGACPLPGGAWKKR